MINKLDRYLPNNYDKFFGSIEDNIKSLIKIMNENFIYMALNERYYKVLHTINKNILSFIMHKHDNSVYKIERSIGLNRIFLVRQLIKHNIAYNCNDTPSPSFFRDIVL